MSHAKFSTFCCGAKSILTVAKNFFVLLSFTNYCLEVEVCAYISVMEGLKGKLAKLLYRAGPPANATGCSLNIIFFLKILEYSGLWSFSVVPRCQCVYTHQAGRTPALHQNWQSSEKSQNFEIKTQYLMNTLGILENSCLLRYGAKNDAKWQITT